MFQLKFNTLIQHNKIIQHIIILSSQHITTFTTNIGIFQTKIKLSKLTFQFQKLSKQPLKRIIRHTIASFPWPIRESNPARTLYKSVALTTELIGQNMVPHHRPTNNPTRHHNTTLYHKHICSKNEPKTIPPIINNHNRITLTHSQTAPNISPNLSNNFFIITPFIPPHTLNIIHIITHTKLITITTTINTLMITTTPTHMRTNLSTLDITRNILSTHKHHLLKPRNNILESERNELYAPYGNTCNVSYFTLYQHCTNSHKEAPLYTALTTAISFIKL